MKNLLLLLCLLPSLVFAQVLTSTGKKLEDKSGGKFSEKSFRIIDSTKLSDMQNITLRGYPFLPGTNINTTLRAAILDVKLYNVPQYKKYCLPVLAKNNVGRHIIRIYDVVGGNLGTAVFDFTRTAYNPSGDIETIIIKGPGNQQASVTIQWTALTDGQIVSNLTPVQSGLSTATYQNQADFDYYLNNKAPTQAFQFVIPSKLYWIAGNPLWLYNDATIMNYNMFARRQVDMLPFSAKNTAGTIVTPYNQYPDWSVITPTESISLTMGIREYSTLDSLTASLPKTSLSKTVSLSVVTKPTSKTINTIVIADSYFDVQWGSGIYAYLSAMATADGNTINFKGTRASYGYLGEARAGWAESTFFRYVPTGTRIAANGDPASALMSSPFMFSPNNTAGTAVFDFAQYLSTNSIGTVDQVVIFLGKNGGDGTQINQMVTSIKAALPTAKVIISYVTPVSYNRSNLSVSFQQKQTDAQNISYTTLFAGRESAGIYLCPASISFPRLYGHNGANTDQVQFNLTSVPQVYLATDHHPNGTGAKAIAWSLYNYMLYASMFSLSWWQLLILLNILAATLYRSRRRINYRK